MQCNMYSIIHAMFYNWCDIIPFSILIKKVSCFVCVCVFVRFVFLCVHVLVMLFLCVCGGGGN